jgi:hypothetical protein
MVEGEPLDSQLFHGYIHGRLAVLYRSSPLVVWKGKPEYSERNEVVPLHGTQHTVDRMRNTGRAI